MGAINKLTNNYEHPQSAIKGKNKYICPSCEKDVIFRNGKIKKPHFSHYKSETPCGYYDKPSETQIHKEAKLLIKSLLDNKKHIYIHRTCNHCNKINGSSSEAISYNENSSAVIEYKFYFNNSNRSADVAFVEKDNIKYIFEICYKNKTREENRPEPWVEINAEELLNNINSGEIIDTDGNIIISCIRNYKCNDCIEWEETENEKRNIYYKKLKQEREERERERQEREIEKQERERQGRERKERERKEREEEKRNREEIEAKMRQPCICGIMIANICVCENPKYELVKLSNNLFCTNCSKWKCRCK
jgi:hypothetical protein